MKVELIHSIHLVLGPRGPLGAIDTGWKRGQAPGRGPAGSEVGDEPAYSAWRLVCTQQMLVE